MPEAELIHTEGLRLESGLSPCQSGEFWFRHRTLAAVCVQVGLLRRAGRGAQRPCCAPAVFHIACSPLQAFRPRAAVPLQEGAWLPGPGEDPPDSDDQQRVPGGFPGLPQNVRYCAARSSDRAGNGSCPVCWRKVP